MWQAFDSPGPRAEPDRRFCLHCAVGVLVVSMKAHVAIPSATSSALVYFCRQQQMQRNCAAEWPSWAGAGAKMQLAAVSHLLLRIHTLAALRCDLWLGPPNPLRHLHSGGRDPCGQCALPWHHSIESTGAINGPLDFSSALFVSVLWLYHLMLCSLFVPIDSSPSVCWFSSGFVALFFFPIYA
jgi:hypothetical protein